MKFYPYEREAEKFVAMLKVGHTKFWGSFYTVALAILMGRHKKLPLFKRGDAKSCNLS